LNDKPITFQDFVMRSCYEACLKSTLIKHVTVIISIKSCSAQKKRKRIIKDLNLPAQLLISGKFHIFAWCVKPVLDMLGSILQISSDVNNSSSEYLMKFIMHLQQIAHLSQPQRAMCT
jgi:hypothetical protein